jgi:hypothetical protein
MTLTNKTLLLMAGMLLVGNSAVAAEKQTP